MRLNNEKKKELLLSNFEIISKKFSGNGRSLGETISKMFSIDVDTAIEMWKYILKEYRNEIIYGDSGCSAGAIYYDDAYCLTTDIYYDASEVIGSRVMDSVVLGTPELKQAIFSITHDNHLSTNRMIQHIIAQNNTSLANELLELLYNNQCRKESWYEIMDDILSSLDNDISDDMYELLTMWVNKVESEMERAKLNVRMLACIE